MHASLDHVWHSLLKPLFEAANVKKIIEIGCADGRNTKNLLGYARKVDGKLHAIDPEPLFDALQWQSEEPDTLHFYRETSLNALPKIEGDCDAVIIDGDHNWYTVYHELLLIEKCSATKGSFPIVVLHDVGWPYGRRDTYADPERIPAYYRQPFAKKGIVPETGELQKDEGLNPHVENALHEHSLKNGILTAVEDFIAQSPLKLSYSQIPGLFGIGIIADAASLDAHSSLRSFLSSISLSDVMRKHLETVEMARISYLIDHLRDRKALSNYKCYFQKSEEDLRFLHRDFAELNKAKQESDKAKQESDMNVALLQKEAKDLDANIEFLRRKAQESDTAFASLKAAFDRMRHSKSWRLTHVLRVLESGIRKLFRSDGSSGISSSTSVSTHNLVRTPSMIACTIVSRNFLSYARVLAKSFHTHHPDAAFVVLLVDPLDADLDTRSEPFTIIPIADLDIPNKEQMCFRYGIRELHTAVKPFFLSWILEKKKPDALLYFDPDILVCSKLSSVQAALSHHSIVLTPHLLQPIDDGLHPSEKDILRAGVYNLGFIGLSQSDITKSFLDWWKDRCMEDCTEQPEKHVFFDQRWIDLVPGLFPRVCVLRDASCNVAYWNLHERSIELEKGQYIVNGKPLGFYHFSGYEPEHPETMCKYSFNERGFSRKKALRTLFDRYHDLLFAERYMEERKKPYGFGRFQNGVSIPLFVRRHFHELSPSDRFRFGDPFLVGRGSYWQWLQEPLIRTESGFWMTNAHEWLRRSTPEILQAFPELDSRFAAWILEHQGTRNHFDLPKEFLYSLQSADVSASPTTALRRVLLKRNTFRFYRFLVSALRALLPSRFLQRIRRFLVAFDLHALPSRPVSASLKPSGLNVVGYFTSGTGVGQLARMNVQSVIAAHIPFTLKNIEASFLPQIQTHLEEHFSSGYPYDTTLMHVNADQVGTFIQSEGSHVLRAKRMIGYWAWEMEVFPDEWIAASKWFDEIWVLSRFSAKAIAAKVECPVHVVPPPVLLEEGLSHTREDFGISEDRTVFLFMFDCLSITERKNPFAVIEAFITAFKREDAAELVIKFSNADHDPTVRSRLAKAAAGHNILLIDSFLSPQEACDLLRLCDVYVSLHRSEGFGFTLAEAMLCGRPVIATNYSGNTDFMNSTNGILIDYKLVALSKDEGPYRKGNVWADPDIRQAASAMRRLYEDPVLRDRLGKKASQDIVRSLSPESLGALIRERILSQEQA